MKTMILTLTVVGMMLGVAAAPAVAQTGLGGAKERNMPSTVGVDPRPDRETMKSRQPAMRAIQPDMYRHYGPGYSGHRYHGQRYYGDRYYGPRHGPRYYGDRPTRYYREGRM